MNQGFKNCFTYLLRVHIRIQGFLYLLTDCVKMLRYFFTKGADAELDICRVAEVICSARVRIPTFCKKLILKNSWLFEINTKNLIQIYLIF